MSTKANEPWSGWAEQMQKWMANPAAMNPFTMPNAAGFATPFAAMGGNALDPQSIMKAIDPEEIDRRIKDMRAVEAWLKLSLSTLDMSIKTMEMQRDAYAAIAKMNEATSDSVHAMSEGVKRATKRASTRRK